jgi:hypothetical protein
MNSEDCFSRCYGMWTAGLLCSMWRQQFLPEHPYRIVWVHGSTHHNSFLHIHRSDNRISHTMKIMSVGGYVVISCSGSSWNCVLLHNQSDYLLQVSRFEINCSQIYEKFCVLFCVWICRCIVKSDIALKFSSMWQSCVTEILYMFVSICIYTHAIIGPFWTSVCAMFR